MTTKTRVNEYYGYVENSVLDNRRAYVYDMYDQLNADRLDDLPTGGILADVWPTGRYVVTDSITVTRTPPPHVLYTRCHQERTTVWPDPSTWERRTVQPKWDSGSAGKPRLDLSGKNAVFYQSSLWNYSQGTLYQPTDRQVRLAQEQALLGLWAGQPRKHMNVMLALIELRDTKKTLTQFTEFTKFGIGVMKGNIQLPRSIISKVGAAPKLAGSCQKMAEAYLWYTFGVQPTVHDVRRFCDDISKGKLKVDGFKRKPLLVGRTYGSGYYSAPENAPGSANVTGYPVGKSGTWWIQATPMGVPLLSKSPAIISANLKGYTVRQVYGKMFAKVREQGKWTWKYFPSKFAWSCPLLRTAWEATPFSFVCDWFLDVGKSIQRLDDLSWVATTRFAFDEPWVSRVIVDTHYAPVYHGKTEMTGDIVRWSSGGYARAEGKWHTQAEAYYQPERRHVVYDRMPASELGLTYASLWREVIPEWQGHLKAYQISTGMALLESVAKLI